MVSRRIAGLRYSILLLEKELQHSHPEHGSNSVVRLVRRDPLDPMAIHMQDGNENEDIQCV